MKSYEPSLKRQTVIYVAWRSSPQKFHTRNMTRTSRYSSSGLDTHTHIVHLTTPSVRPLPCENRGGAAARGDEHTRRAFVIGPADTKRPLGVAPGHVTLPVSRDTAC